MRKLDPIIVGLFWASSALAQISDPVPEPIIASGLTVSLSDVVHVPDSGVPLLPARVSMLAPAYDGSDRLFVNDLRGRLYVIVDDQISLYLDLAASHPFFIDAPGLGTGFHSFAFHPEFASNGYFYTVHTETPDAGVPDLVSPATNTPALHSVVTEWKATDSTAGIFSGTSRQLLRIEQPGFIHSLQEIAFQPDLTSSDANYGLLYLGQGDGGILGSGNAQSLDSPHGAILRIDPLGGNAANGAYGIPPDNPYAVDANPVTLDEIWAYGLRNPHRFSWDTGGTHKMLIGDIGELNVEEINLGMAGANYGWDEREGPFLFDFELPEFVFTLPDGDDLLGYSYPAALYDHDEGQAVVGGFVYRGNDIPELTGQYVFGDIVSGRLFHVPVEQLNEGAAAHPLQLSLIDSDGVALTLANLTPGNRVDLKFGIDADREIYILTKSDGMVRRLVSSFAVDSDSDGVPDDNDNCTVVANADQRDTNGDNIGNMCDPDYNQDCQVNFLDLLIISDSFFTNTNPDTDHDGNGLTNFADLQVIQSLFFGAPGPAAQPCAAQKGNRDSQ